MTGRQSGGLWGLATLVGVSLASSACDHQAAAPPGGRDVGGDIVTDANGADAGDRGDAADADGPDAAAAVVPGNVVWRRLNRTEYRNTVRDLLGTALDPGKDLPADDLGYGFDNIASVLTMSPLHLELYQQAARALAGEIVAVPITSEQRLVVEGETFPAVDYGQATDDAFVLWSNGQLTSEVDVPRDGTWRFEMRAWEDPAGDERAQVAVWIDGVVVETFSLAQAPAVYALERPLSKGRHALAVEFLNDFYLDPDDRNAYVDYFGIAGPVPLDVYADTAWARHVKCAPAVMGADASAGTSAVADPVAARACAEATVKTLADGAWRRPAEAADVASLMGLYDAALSDGATAIEALELPLRALLMSPRFLFKVEIPRGDAAAGDALDGYEIATRLSYFLWSTMPDAALLAAAARGDLDGANAADGIAAQVKRMLADPRAEGLVESFAGQWLYVRNVDNAIPDLTAFPAFDDALRHAMSQEMRLFFRSFVFEDRSLLELLTATDTFVNRRLAEHYGLAGADVPATDDDWQKVSVPGRRGVLGEAGLLTALSTPFRTSVVRRGKWVLTQLLCDEPAAPPPGVQGLVDMTPAGQTPTTLRQKMTLHESEERCRTCHQTMDGIGFGLEGFDGIGAARGDDHGMAIDATGDLRGHPFDGAVELAGVIAEDPRLPPCMVDKLMIYALGRGLGGDDEPLLQRLYAQFAARGYRFAALVELIATSEAFRMREAGR